MWLRLASAIIGLLLSATSAAGHDAPFSYLDLRIEAGVLDAALVVHVIDVAYELKIERPATLLEPQLAAERADAISAVLQERLQLAADGTALPFKWTSPEPLPDREALRIGG